MKKYFLTFLALSFISLTGLAVDDRLPEYTARFGGEVKKTDKTYLELVHQKEEAKLYITGRDQKNLADQKLSLAAFAHVNGKKYPVELSLRDDHYSANLANSYLRKEKNYSLMIMITFPGSTESATFKLQNK